LQSAQNVQRRGYDQSLWLDPIEMKYIEELSGMNFFILQNGELHTPQLNGSFLAGITRDSIISLARHKGITVVERDIPIQEVLTGIQSGAVSEIFACGTAAIVSPVSVIADADGTNYAVNKVDDLAATLRQSLLAIQEQREADPFSWTAAVAEHYSPA
ncbi:MAG TPA: branched-chain amino acid aminotransferase, partial [Cellvibrionales bacterium]|nr:branched-chain amino acid aminotransferase [Cellvibrionales bacterium]